MKTRRRTVQPPFSRLVHLLLLAAWLLSSQGIAPALFLVAVVVDGDHGVRVIASQSGDVSVVLSHEGMDAAASPHQHDALCALVVMFAKKPVEGEVDHVLAFKSVEDSSRTLRRASMEVQMPVLAVASLGEFASRFVCKPADDSGTRVQAPVWSSGLQIKACRTILRC